MSGHRESSGDVGIDELELSGGGAVCVTTGMSLVLISARMAASSSIRRPAAVAARKAAVFSMTMAPSELRSPHTTNAAVLDLVNNGSAGVGDLVSYGIGYVSNKGDAHVAQRLSGRYVRDDARGLVGRGDDLDDDRLAPDTSRGPRTRAPRPSSCPFLARGRPPPIRAI